MTRNEKIKKLANAIRAYRGVTSSPAGAVKTEWIRSPQPHKRPDIVRYLLALGRTKEQIEQDAVAIDGF
jgi:hypothetical protein